MVKLLNIIPCLSGGGAEQQLRYLSNELASNGHEVHIAYLYEGKQFGAINDKISLHKLTAASNYDIRILFQIFVLIRNINPDVVQSWIIQSDIFAAIACPLLKKKWVVRESNAPSLRQGSSFKFFIRRLLMRFANTIISNSMSGYNYWKSVYPMKNNKLIENGFPIDDLAMDLKGDVEVQELDKNIAACLTGTALLFVGRLEFQKNLDKLIAAISLVKEDGLNLIICGAGSLEHELKDKVKHLDLSNNIFFIGSVSKNVVYHLMREVDGLVLPSHFEGFPNVVVEAMLNKCPLVVSDIEPHRAFLDEKSALFVCHTDEVSIADGIEQLLQDKNSARLRVEAAYAIAERLSIKVMVEKYEYVYSNVI